MMKATYFLCTLFLGLSFQVISAQTPRSAEDYNNRGLERRSRGDIEGAIQDFDKAIALNPNDAGFYYNRARAREASRDLNAAIDDYDKAIKKDSGFLPAYINRGEIRRRLGNGDCRLYRSYKDRRRCFKHKHFAC